MIGDGGGFCLWFAEGLWTGREELHLVEELGGNFAGADGILEGGWCSRERDHGFGC